MRRLGQHFLINRAAIKKIISALALRGGETIIEIGAGHGELTFPLIAQGARVTAIEKDPRLCEELASKLRGRKSVARVIEGDILKTFPSLAKTSELRVKNYKIVGNLPYYITGRLLRLIGEAETKPERCVFTLQREVAERLAASPPRMNRLSASVGFWAKPTLVAFLLREDFRPMPEVASAVVGLVRREEKFEVGDKEYYRLVKIIFQQPRKTLVNNLVSGLKEKRESVLEKIQMFKLSPRARPQDMDVKTIVRLAALLRKERRVSP